jgi:hypothetical protein
MPLDAPNDYGDTATVREPGDLPRHPKTGAPQVTDPTKTRQPQGKKDELIAQAVAKGIEVPAKATIQQLKELIGVEPAWELYGRPSGYGDLIDNPFNLIKWNRADATNVLFFIFSRGADIDEIDRGVASLGIDDFLKRSD